MEVKEKSKKRELIKTIAIIFLVILLLLTFFSQTIMNRSLPEVSTKLIASGSISARIRGSGTVSPNESYEVIINETRTIQSVCVKVGDQVNTGDLLFVLEDVESAELQAAQDALANLNINYQKQLLNFTKEYADNDRTVKQIREDLEAAYAKRAENQITDADETALSYAKGEVASIKAQLRQLALDIETLQAQQTEDKTIADAQANVTKAESEITTLKGDITTQENTIKSIQQEITKLTNELNSSEGGSSTTKDLESAQNALRDALNQLESDWIAYASDYRELVNYVNDVRRENYSSGRESLADGDQQVAIAGELVKLGNNVTIPVTPSKDDTDDKNDDEGTSGNKAQTSADPAESGVSYSDYTRYKKAYDTLIADQKAVDTADNNLRWLQANQNDTDHQTAETEEKKREEIRQKERELTAANTALGQLNDSLQQAEYKLSIFQYELDQAEIAHSGLNTQIREAQANQRTLEDSQTTATEALDTLQKEYDAKKAAYEEALATIETKEKELENSLAGKDIDKQLDNLDLQAARLEIQKQQETVEKLRSSTVATEVKAKVSGTIASINVSAGKENTSGSAMAVINVTDRGYIMKISVTNEQSRQVKVGDTAEVTNYYWGNDVTATLEAITADPSSPGQKKLLVFRITGDIESGTNITLSIGQKSANYDTIVPKSALREDTNGNFVLVITSKNTPLGNRFYATRADVQILAEDDTTAAVSGLAANDYVITTSSQPLTAGMQVRMVENA